MIISGKYNYTFFKKDKYTMTNKLGILLLIYDSIYFKFNIKLK